jgi:osmoprotectant transport system substrate-binding protein
MKKLFISLVLSTLVIGCTRTEPLHIGSKNFTEQFILAEIIAQLIENEKIPVKRSIPYGDTFTNMEAIKNGILDLYVEYNGTGLIMLGRPPINNGDKAFAEVKSLFEPLGLEWLERLGFANNYVLVMRSDRALALKISKISDLVKIKPDIKMAMEPEFTERPLDGLAALQRRYGLSHIVPLVIDNDKSVIYQALLDSKVDVTEAFSTEGRIEDFGLKILKDDLEFFPVYEPSPLVRADTLKRYPQLRTVLQKLAGLINTSSMRQMNREVELEGQDYRAVAQAFLIKHRLIDKPEKSKKSEELVIAAGTLHERGRSISKALRAVRKTFPGRSVKVLQVADPLEPLAKREARLGILSAEAFFKMTDDFLPVPNPSVEALGVIGTKMAHIVTRRDSKMTSINAISTLGVGAFNAASDRTAKMVFTSLGLQKKIRLVHNDNLSRQVEALKNRQLDAIFLMVPPGHERLTMIMNQGIFKLISFSEWQQGNHLIRFPFFRLARIPANTYDQQPQMIETISSQMVLAASTPANEIVGNRGPATVISANVQPLSDPIVIHLSKALNTGEKLDPALPSANILKPQTRPISSPINPSKTESFFNFFIMLAIVFFFYLLLQKEKKEK